MLVSQTSMDVYGQLVLYCPIDAYHTEAQAKMRHDATLPAAMNPADV